MLLHHESKPGVVLGGGRESRYVTIGAKALGDDELVEAIEEERTWLWTKAYLDLTEGRPPAAATYVHEQSRKAVNEAQFELPPEMQTRVLDSIHKVTTMSRAQATSLGVRRSTAQNIEHGIKVQLVTQTQTLHSLQ